MNLCLDGFEGLLEGQLAHEDEVEGVFVGGADGAQLLVAPG
jgi:hypothetical protein